MRHLIPFTALLVFSFATAAAAQGKGKPGPLTLSLSTYVTPAPAQVMAKVSVEPDPRSRSLTIEWWSEDGAGGSHAVTLDGDRAAKRQDFAIKRIDEGRYVVRALLLRDDGSILKKEASLIVVGAAGGLSDAQTATGSRR